MAVSAILIIAAVLAVSTILVITAVLTVSAILAAATILVIAAVLAVSAILVISTVLAVAAVAAVLTVAALALLALELLELLRFFGFEIVFAGGPVPASAPSAQNGQVAHMIFVIFFFIVHFYKDADCLAQHVDAFHLAAEAVISLDFVADLGKAAVEFLVGVRFVLREVLLFCHLDGDRDEIAHPGVAAEGPAADTVAAQYLGLVADADLAQLDAGAENACEVFDQVAEVHAPVRREVKQHLAVVKCVLRVDELHLEAVGLDLLLADAVSLFLLLAVAAVGLVVLERRNADDLRR